MVMRGALPPSTISRCALCQYCQTLDPNYDDFLVVRLEVFVDVGSMQQFLS